MHAYATAAWSNFFVAAAGAAAALAGLVFVSVSINLARILAHPSLPGRAAETIVMFALVLATSLCGLVPQDRIALGAELAAVGTLGWATVTVLVARAFKDERRDYRHWQRRRLVLSQLATLPFVIAGASVMAAVGGGLYWTLAGVMLAFAVGILNAWVLLVEILR